ncbi:MAG: ABC-2 transporter permease [Bacillota bacterium]|nr:ABC-2 transporter permease [Bacillota bacterium]
MSQWFVLLQKEILEMWRNLKWVWVPITFILLGVKDPISSYYMPQIIKAMGGLPKGAVFKLPPPTAVEIFVKGMGQFNTIGVLIMVLTTMGVIAAERKSGVAAMILVKPVSYTAFITSKWAGSLLLMLFSFFMGSIATWYYTGILFKWIPMADFFGSFLLYAVWFVVAISITVFFSSVLLAPGAAGFISLAVVGLIGILSSLLSKWMERSPAQLADYANQLLAGQSLPDQTWISLFISFVLIIVLLIGSIFIFGKKELAS